MQLVSHVKISDFLKIASKLPGDDSARIRIHMSTHKYVPIKKYLISKYFSYINTDTCN